MLGVSYLGSVIGYDKALAAGLYPFLLSEFFKIVLAAALITSIRKYINNSYLYFLIYWIKYF